MPNTSSTRTPSPLFHYNNNTDITRPTAPTPQLFSLISMDKKMEELDKEMETFIKTKRNKNIKSQEPQVKFCSPKGTPQSKEEVIGKVLHHELRIFTEDGKEKVISNVKKDTSDRKISSNLKARPNPTRSYEDYEANYKREQRYNQIIELTETTLDTEPNPFDNETIKIVFSILKIRTSLTTRFLISDFDYSSKAHDFSIFNDILDIIKYVNNKTRCSSSDSEPSSPDYPVEPGECLHKKRDPSPIIYAKQSEYPHSISGSTTCSTTCSRLGSTLGSSSGSTTCSTLGSEADSNSAQDD